MKKTLITILITVTIFSCQKGLDWSEPKPIIHYGTVIFYTLSPEADKQWEVYIDSSSNSYKGLVPYTVIEPPCDNSSVAPPCKPSDGDTLSIIKKFARPPLP